MCQASVRIHSGMCHGCFVLLSNLEGSTGKQTSEIQIHTLRNPGFLSLGSLWNQTAPSNKHLGLLQATLHRATPGKTFSILKCLILGMQPPGVFDCVGFFCSGRLQTPGRLLSLFCRTARGGSVVALGSTQVCVLPQH